MIPIKLILLTSTANDERQLVKLYDYILKSNEKYIKGEKIIIYYIVPVSMKNPNNKIEKNCVISFD